MVTPVRNEEDSIVAAARASKAISRTDLFVVIDDGSSGNTGDAARLVSAIMVRHSVNRGKASAMEAGAKVVATRDSEEGPARLILFLDADSDDLAAETYPLMKAVISDGMDCVITNLPKQAGAGGHGFVARLTQSVIRWATEWEPVQPLSGQRHSQLKTSFDCLLLSPSRGVEADMAVDLLVQGYLVQEVPCELTHRTAGNDFADHIYRLYQFLYVFLAATIRSIRRVHAPRQLHLNVSGT